MQAIEFEGFGGTRLRGEAWGEIGDPSVVILPAGGQYHLAYRHLGRAVAATGRRALLVDLRGHGLSDWSHDGRYDLDAFKGDVAAILGQLDTRPVLVGAGLGGLAALVAAGEGAANNVSGLVLADVALELNADEVTRMRQLMSDGATGYRDMDEAVAAARLMAPGRTIDAESVRRHLRKDCEGVLRWHWDARFLDGFDLAAERSRLSEAARLLRVPVQVVRGSSNSLISHSAVASLAELVPQAELVELESAGYLVASERSDAFNAEVTAFLEREVPRRPICFEGGSDLRSLRHALGCFGTGVAIVSARDGEKPVGLTINSFTSVSLDPPLVLFCLATSSARADAFRSASHFAINVLHIGQQPASVAFTGAGKRFDAVAWRWSDSGCPVLDQSLSLFECETRSIQEAGDHLVIIGEVKQARFEPSRDPLLYFRGRYQRLHFG